MAWGDDARAWTLFFNGLPRSATLCAVAILEDLQQRIEVEGFREHVDVTHRQIIVQVMEHPGVARAHYQRDIDRLEVPLDAPLHPRLRVLIAADRVHDDEINVLPSDVTHEVSDLLGTAERSWLWPPPIQTDTVIE